MVGLLIFVFDHRSEQYLVGDIVVVLLTSLKFCVSYLFFLLVGMIGLRGALRS